MKYTFILSMFMSIALLTEAQAGGSGANGRTRAGKVSSSMKKTTGQAAAPKQYHGSKDTTPGSPMGTGGAGGSGMSGSTAGSASESALHQSKANGQSSKQLIKSSSNGNGTTNGKRTRPQNSNQ